MNKSEPTFDCSNTSSYNTENYIPLIFDEAPADNHKVRELVKYILNHCYNQKFSINGWEKQSDIKFKEICSSIAIYRKINHSSVDIPEIKCEWLDTSISIAPIWCFPCNENNDSMTLTLESKTNELYPQKPRLDREGFATTSMQLPLQIELIKIHKELIENGYALFEGGEWIIKLMSFFNIAVSLVDITLMQIYYKAKYDHKTMNLKFDENELGSTVGRTMDEKFKWIGKITGKPLNDAKHEVAIFKKIKSVRNHLNHFDPPFFAYTIEDVAGWLSSINEIGMLLLKIRDKLNVNISETILEMILLPKVKFIPVDTEKKRHKQKDNVGYGSCFLEGTGHVKLRSND